MGSKYLKYKNYYLCTIYVISRKTHLLVETSCLSKKNTKTCVTIHRSKLKTKVLTKLFFSGLRPSGYWTIITEKCSLILNMDDTKLFSSNVVKFTVWGLIFISLVRLYFFQISIVFFDIVTNINIFNLNKLEI